VSGAAGPLSVGIIGAGEIAFAAHLPALLALDGVRVDWIADADESKARIAARSYGIGSARLPDRLEDLPPADVVLLTMPYGARAPYYRPLSQRGAAVYVEKPFALSLREHDAICALFRPERIACGLQRRSGATARVLREVVQSRPFGRLLSIRVEFGGPGVRTGGRYSSRLDLAGGGILVETGVHPLDLVLHASGATGAEVVRAKMIRHRGFDIHTEATVRTHGADGFETEIDLLVTQLRYTGMRNVFLFENAEVTCDSFGEKMARLKPRGGASSWLLGGPGAEYPLTPAQMCHAHWSQFLDGVRTGIVNPTCAVESRATTDVIEQLYARAGS
jgi:predicted dehydrogenase